MSNSADLNCVLIGESTLPQICGQILLDNGFNILRVISSEEKVSQWAINRGIPYSKSIKDASGQLSDNPFSYLFSISNPSILSPSILKLAKKASINYHDALLPHYAGSHATSWVILNKESVHGTTWHLMGEAVDTGDILVQDAINISDDETALTLNAKCYASAIEGFRRLISDIKNDKLTRNQQDLSKRTFFRRSMRPSFACVLKWDQSAEALSAFVRALDFGNYQNPLGVPKLLLDRGVAWVGNLEITKQISDFPPGTITSFNEESLAVSTTSYDVLLKDLCRFDGSPISITNLMYEYGLRIGTQLPEIPKESLSNLLAAYEEICSHEQFWVKRLGTFSPLTFSGSYKNLEEPARYKSHSIQNLGEMTGLIWNKDAVQTLIATFQVYLSRMFNASSIDIGIRVRRIDDETKSFSQIFSKVVPLRCALENTESFETVAENLKEALLESERNLTYSYDVIARYPELSNIQSAPNSYWPIVVDVIPGGDETFLYADWQEEQYGIVFQIFEDGRKCRLVYDASEFDEEQVNRIANQYIELLKGTISEPSKAIAKFSLLSPEESDLVLRKWNDTAGDYSFDYCLHHFFDENAQRCPHNLAVVSGEYQLTYEDVWRRSKYIASRLQKLEVKPNALVGIVMEKGWEEVVGVLGVMYSGAAYIPIDPHLPTTRLNYILAQSNVSIVLTQEKVDSVMQWPDCVQIRICVDTLDVNEANFFKPTVKSSPKDLAYVIFTSGSTGAPKGVMITHESAVNTIIDINRRYSIKPEDKILAVSALNFDLSVFDIFGPLSVGACIVIPDHRKDRDPAHWVDLIKCCGVTLWNSVPTLFSMLIEEARKYKNKISTLRLALLSGDWIPVSLPEKAKSIVPEMRIISLGGATEAAIWSISYPIEEICKNWKSIPYGRPLTNQRFYILDNELNPVPIGAIGELFIAGIGLAQGYWNDSEKTERSFISHPTLLERLYRTGDWGRYRSDGNIEFLGRIDTQIKLNGLRIELGEIDTALLSFEYVNECLTILREDISGEKRIVSYIVPGIAQVPDSSKIRKDLLDLLPSYMIPHHIVKLGSLPLTSNGKIDRGALPKPNLVSRERLISPPTNEIEELMCQVWREVLSVNVIGIDDDFFDIGGDSLSALLVVGKLKERAINISTHSLYDAPTIREVSKKIEVADIVCEAVSDQLVSGDAPLLANHYWFLKRRNLNHWNAAFLFEILVKVNVDVVQAAIGYLLRHHDGLRHIFIRRNGEYRQHVLLPDELGTWWQYINLGGVKEEEIANQIVNHCSAMQTSLDISKILFKVIYFDLGTPLNSRLFFLFHRVLMDPVSASIVFKDFVATYRALDSGRPPSLARKTTSVKAWAEWQDNFAQAGATKYFPYWCSRTWNRYKPLPDESHSLPASKDGVIPDYAISTLDESETARLDAVAKEMGFQIDHVLVTAILLAYEKWTGSAALFLLFMTNGRVTKDAVDVDLSRTVGWLPNYAPLFLDLNNRARNASFEDCVHLIKTQMNELQDGGLSYSCLKFMNRNPEIHARMNGFPEFQLEFSYIPQSQKSQSDSALSDFMRPAKEPSGPEEGLMHSSFPPFAKSYYEDGKLKIRWGYSPTQFRDVTMQYFLANQMEYLRAFINAKH